MNAKPGQLRDKTCTLCKKRARDERGDSKLTGWFSSSCDCPEEILEDDKIELSPDTKPREFDFGSRYEVEERLGSGGMATVFRVKDNEVGARFALKVFSDRPDELEGMQKRLERESRALMELTHANIGAAFGDGKTADGFPYLILDWIDGSTLAELIERGALDEKRAIGIFMQIAEALQHAHLKGIVHKDLKPSNIIVSQDEYGNDLVKVIDFGIATVLQTDTDATGEMAEGLGTPLYMSPEQSRGDKVDGRTDIYSLGCVMYETLAGVPPFSGDTAVKVILKHLKEKPKPIRGYPGREGVSKELERLVLQCLEKEPSRRYQLVDEIVQDLINVQDGRVRQFHFSDLKPHFSVRYCASLVDGLILTSFFLLVWQTLSIAYHVPSPSIELIPFLACGFLLVPLLSIFLGPAVAVLLVIAMFCAGKAALIPYAMLEMTSLAATLMLMPIYYGCFESSRLRATPGKLLFRLAVVDSKGGRLSFWSAILRQLSRPLHYRMSTLETVTINKIRDQSKQSLRKRLQNSLIPLLVPGVDDSVNAQVVKRIALDAPHELHLGGSLDLNTFTLEQLYWVNKEIRSSLYASSGYFAFMLLLIGCALGSELSLAQTTTVASYLFVCILISGADWFLFFKTKRLIKKTLRERKENREGRLRLTAEDDRGTTEQC